MEIPKSFRPKQDLESHVNNLLLSKKKSDETCLLILTRITPDIEPSTSLYFWKFPWDKPYLLVKFPYVVWSAYFFDEELYLGLRSGAILKLPGERFVTKRDGPVANIHSHGGKLYDASNVVISETLTGKLVDVREQPVRELYSYNGVLYNGGLYKGVYDTFKKRKVFNTDSNVHSLFCDGQVFYAGTADGDIRNLKTYEKIKSRGSIIHAIGKYKHMIYDGGTYKSVFKDLSNSALFDFKDEVTEGIWDITEVPLNLVEKLVNY